MQKRAETFEEQAAREWRAERDRRERKPSKPEGPPAAPMLDTTTALIFADMEPPMRQFLDDAGLIPMRNVTMLSGDGGTGKSLLAIQLALAVATGTDWIGIAVHSGAVLYYSAEEDRDEIHIRCAEIAKADAVDLHDSGDLHFCYMAGLDATLATESERGTRLKATPLFERLAATVANIAPALVILDNLADVFSGNENSRSLAKQFVGLLRSLAVRYDTTVLLLGHPSLTGLNSGSGASGSTAWNNSVRSRLYLHKDTDASGYEADQTQRLLEIMKANYAPRGQPIGLKWREGRFIRSDPPKPFDDVSTADLERAQQLFTTGAWRVSERSDNWGGYAVAGILGLDIGQGIGATERTAAQEAARKKVRTILATWVTNKAIRIEPRTDEHRKERPCYVA